MLPLKTNYHTHSNYSDGVAKLENLVEKAIDANFSIIGFTDHSPVPFKSEWNMKFEKLDSYFHEIERLKSKYKNQILILKSLEIDFFENKNFIKNFKKDFNLDYSLGSVHYLPKFFEDGTILNIDKHKYIFKKAIKELYLNNVKNLVKEYYYNINLMIQNDTPDIIAHLDLVNKFNEESYFFNSNEKWYKNLITETLELIKQKGSIIEINCRSKYLKILNNYSPEKAIINQIKNFNIPITINGDIHSPKEFENYWENTLFYLKNITFEHLTIIDDKAYREIKI